MKRKDEYAAPESELLTLTLEGQFLESIPEDNVTVEDPNMRTDTWD